MDIDRFSGVGCRGWVKPHVFVLFDKSAIFSYHSVNSTIISCHSVFSAKVLYQVAAFWFDVQYEGGKLKISDFIFIIRFALKLNKSFKATNI